jgi:hypothetical protein
MVHRSLPTILVACIAASGCSKAPEFVSVRGQVLYKDKPLNSGVVMFQPENGPPARGNIQSDGTFELATLGKAEGARIGSNKVRIASRGPGKANAGEVALGSSEIPERYNDVSTSGLTVEVKSTGNDPFVFRLTD